MPLSNTQAQALPGNFSSSRKRTHAQITRSESRSQSPCPPSKRRRTVFSPSYPRMSSSPDSTGYSSDGLRFPGDGFDYRRPAMASTSGSQQNNQDTIDLTLEDDSPPPRPVFHNTGPSTGRQTQAPGIYDTQNHPTAHALYPNTQDHSHSQDIIDLSSDDEDDVTQRAHAATRVAPPSPEVQFIGERQLRQPPAANIDPDRRPHLPTPPGMRAHFGSMANFIRDVTQNMFTNLRGNREFSGDALNQIDGIMNHPAMGRGGPEGPPDTFPDEYDGLQMDYGRPAFNFGPEILLIEDPNIAHGIANRATEPTYKEPVPPREGFTRNYEEDDMLICVLCGDELATGKTDQKQQVWIIKQCGHAYCGDCAHNRSIAKSKTNKDSKRATGKKLNTFRVCAVPNCDNRNCKCRLVIFESVCTKADFDGTEDLMWHDFISSLNKQGVGGLAV